MRVYVSVDMEGVAGVATLDQIVRGGAGYPSAQMLMTAEASAAVRGAFSAGADEVVVSDSHGTMDNLLPDRLDGRAHLVSGAPRRGCMMDGKRSGDALAVLIGYHAGAGTDGVLAHSFSINFTELRVNDEPVTEAQVNAWYAAAYGVPVGVVTGDDRICSTVKERLPTATTVEVKRALGFAAADSLSPDAACGRIEEAVAETCRRAESLVCPSVADTLTVDVDFTLPLAADLAATVPGTLRVSGRTVRQVVEDVPTLIGIIMTWYRLGALAAQQLALVANRR